MQRTPKKRARIITKRFVKIVAGVSMIAVLALTFALTRLLLRYRESRSEYAQIADAAVATLPPQEYAAVDTPNPAETAISAVSASPSPQISEVPITIDWLNLKATNRQIVGWLYCEDTNINYPVVQTENNTYYLTHNAKRKEDQAGALFVDYRNAMDSSYENLIIYGHRMKDGSMFGQLAKFSEKSYCDKHTAFYYLTEQQSYRIDVFACRTVRGDIKYFPTSFTGEQTLQTYFDKAISQSYWQEAPQKRPDGAFMITLSTCSKYDFQDSPKLLVHGWAVPIQ